MESLVEVHWFDSHTIDRWIDPEEYDFTRKCNCRTVGYLLRQTEDHIVIVSTKGDIEVCQTFVIPIVCVTQMTHLKRCFPAPEEVKCAED